MIKTRLILMVLFGAIGGLVGTTLGVAGSVFGLFFGAVGGSFVFGAGGAVVGWFAAKDVDEGLVKLDAMLPRVKPRLVRIVYRIGRIIFLTLGFMLLAISWILRRGRA